MSVHLDSETLNDAHRIVTILRLADMEIPDGWRLDARAVYEEGGCLPLAVERSESGNWCLIAPAPTDRPEEAPRLTGRDLYEMWTEALWTREPGRWSALPAPKAEAWNALAERLNEMMP